jgi:hypothetical protein
MGCDISAIVELDSDTVTSAPSSTAPAVEALAKFGLTVEEAERGKGKGRDVMGLPGFLRITDDSLLLVVKFLIKPSPTPKLSAAKLEISVPAPTAPTDTVVSLLQSFRSSHPPRETIPLVIRSVLTIVLGKSQLLG